MRRRLCWLLAMLAPFGCAPTETGNPGEEEGVVILGLTAHTTDPAAVAIGTSEGGLAVTSASVRVESVSVAACGSAADDVRVEASSAVDLVAGGTVQIPSGEACGISVVLASGGDADGPAFSVEGARADGVSISLSSETNARFSVAPSSGAVRLHADLAPFLSVNLAAWLGGLGIDVIAPDGTGSLVIDTATHPSVVDDAGAALAAAATLHFDSDGDGALSAEELHDVAAGHP